MSESKKQCSRTACTNEARWMLSYSGAAQLDAPEILRCEAHGEGWVTAKKQGTDEHGKYKWTQL